MKRYNKTEQKKIKNYFENGGLLFIVFLTSCVKIENPDILDQAFLDNRILSKTATTL